MDTEANFRIDHISTFDNVSGRIEDFSYNFRKAPDTLYVIKISSENSSEDYIAWIEEDRFYVNTESNLKKPTNVQNNFVMNFTKLVNFGIVGLYIKMAIHFKADQKKNRILVHSFEILSDGTVNVNCQYYTRYYDDYDADNLKFQIKFEHSIPNFASVMIRSLGSCLRVSSTKVDLHALKKDSYSKLAQDQFVFDSVLNHFDEVIEKDSEFYELMVQELAPYVTKSMLN